MSVCHLPGLDVPDMRWEKMSSIFDFFLRDFAELET